MSSEQTDRWLEVRNAFDQALDLEGPARDALLDRMEHEDQTLAREVRSLLMAYLDDPEFLEAPPHAAELTSLPVPGVRVGPFKLGRRLGEGGMGMVFLGLRVDGAFEQTVAVKFVRSGLSEEQLTRRFESERAILARLNHPNIAHLYDGGVTESGWPYLVMEYIEGRPITQYCSEVRASVAERVKLLQSVCRTVQYAHQNLVVHRDLKPSNILVTGQGTVKLLDFGVGRILAAKGEEANGSGDPATLTFALTPSYSAPEQLRGEPVSTSADVYALGTIAYELVVGQRPIEVDGLDLLQAERRVREEHPQPPSHALETLRRTGAEVPSGVVDADLDTIVLKALRKEPEQRYASANALAEDLGRWLVGHPIAARDPTVRYRAAKFVRRNKIRVGAAGVVTLLFTTAALGTVWQARVATANARQATVAMAEAQVAVERTQRVNDFLQRILQTPNPSWYIENEVKGPDVTVLEALVEAASRIEVDLADDPEIQADIHHTLGDTYRALGEWDAMLPHFERALEIRTAHFKPPHPKIAESLFYMAAAHATRDNLVASDSLIRAAIDMQRLRDEGNNLPYMLTHLSSSLEMQGRFSEALAIQRQAAANSEVRFGRDHPSTVHFQARVADLLLDVGQPRAAQEVANGLDLRAATPQPRITLARIRAAEGGLDQAELEFRRLDASGEGGTENLVFEREVLIPAGKLAEAGRRLDGILAAGIGAEPSVTKRVTMWALGLRSRVARFQGRTREAATDLDRLDSLIAVQDAQGQDRFYWSERRLVREERAFLAMLGARYEEARDLLNDNLEEAQGQLGSQAHREETLRQIAGLEDAWGMPGPGERRGPAVAAGPR